MRINRGLLGWGIFFILLGAVPLAVRAGALDPEAVRRAWELWPLILIGIGLGLVLERTRFAIVGGLIVAITFGLMGGALIATGFSVSAGGVACGIGSGGGSGAAFPDQQGSFEGGAAVRLEMNCGDVTATAVDGPSWTLTGTSDAGQVPEVHASGSQLTVRSAVHDGFAIVRAASRWQVTLGRAVPTDLGLTVNAGSGRLDLRGMTIPGLDVSVNAGDANVDMGSVEAARRLDGSVNAGSLSITLPRSAGTLDGSLSVNAGSLELCAPEGTAVRLRIANQPLASNNFDDADLVEVGNTWTTPGFDSAASRVTLDLSANLGSIAFNPEDGCD